MVLFDWESRSVSKEYGDISNAVYFNSIRVQTKHEEELQEEYDSLAKKIRNSNGSMSKKERRVIGKKMDKIASLLDFHSRG